jgi:hypothetical protein
MGKLRRKVGLGGICGLWVVVRWFSWKFCAEL